MRSSLTILVLLAVLAVSVWLILARIGGPAAPPARGLPPIPPIAAEAEAPPPGPPGPLSPPDCRGAPAFAAAASDNAASLTGLVWSPLGAPETGWQAYEPLIAHEIASGCPPQGTAFAQDLSRWQSRHGLRGDGRMTPETFAAFYRIWHARRPFARIPPSQCPPPLNDADLAQAAPAESYGGKAIRLRPDALQAWRRMVAAARAENPQIAASPQTLQIFSGYRDPTADMIRCLGDGACDGRRRTWCSAHRTGTAVDLYLGSAPGFALDSTAPESRLYLSRTPAYRWLVADAARFGFVNYVYEPWHWEWAGDQAAGPPRG